MKLQHIHCIINIYTQNLDDLELLCLYNENKFLYISDTTLTSSSQNLSNSPGTPPGNRAIMSSPFSVLSRPEHAFAHIHPQGHQVRMFFSFQSVV